MKTERTKLLLVLCSEKLMHSFLTIDIEMLRCVLSF